MTNTIELTTEQKAAMKIEAKDLGINVVGKSAAKILDLIDEKTGRTRELTMKVLSGEEITEADEESLLPAKDPASLHQIRQIAKELKIPYTKTTPRADLVFAIADVKGWANEKAEVIEYLLVGGTIEEVPGFTGIAPKPNNRETSAGGKVEPQEPKKPRKLNKAKDAAKPASKPRKASAKATSKPEGDLVSIQDICDELSVEGRVARRKLRGSDIVKPSESGWIWEAGHADIAKVKELLKK